MQLCQSKISKTRRQFRICINGVIFPSWIGKVSILNIFFPNLYQIKKKILLPINSLENRYECSMLEALATKLFNSRILYFSQFSSFYSKTRPRKNKKGGFQLLNSSKTCIICKLLYNNVIKMPSNLG